MLHVGSGDLYVLVKLRAADDTLCIDPVEICEHPLGAMLGTGWVSEWAHRIRASGATGEASLPKLRIPTALENMLLPHAPPALPRLDSGAARWMSVDEVKSLVERDSSASLDGKVSVSMWAMIEAALDRRLIEATALPGRNGKPGPTMYAAAL